ncbi:MAG: beta-lactamase family protein, partial [Saprospiraceae bacterium]|nr:beta-lactamase family protein [Saprospiraceae bacterium]
GIRGQVKFEGEEEHLSTVADKMSEYKIPALSLTIMEGGQIAWSATYHNPAFPTEEGLDCNSLFQAASLSKPVTFMAALRMHAGGAINLDENVENYLKEYKLPKGKQTPENPVTLRNIFSHTSGLTPGGYEGYPKDQQMPSDIAVLKGSEGVNSPAIEVINTPNEVLAYSGGGYTLAELALQDELGDSFSNIMEKWILKPVGMNHAEFTQPMTASASKKIANGYTTAGEMIDGGWKNHPEQAAAGLWSTSTDLALFLIEIYKGYNGKSTVFTQADIQGILAQERDMLVYGFIVNKTEDNDISITHYGGNAGYRTGMTISLTTGNGLVYLIDSDNGGSLGNELLLSAARVYDWPFFQQTAVVRAATVPIDLKVLEGDYKWNNQVDLKIQYDASKDKISMFFPNGDAYELTPIEGDGFSLIHEGTGVRVTFTKEDNYQSFSLYGQTAVRI